VEGWGYVGREAVAECHMWVWGRGGGGAREGGGSTGKRGLSIGCVLIQDNALVKASYHTAPGAAALPTFQIVVLLVYCRTLV
jgi:hypothetical protein